MNTRTILFASVVGLATPAYSLPIVVAGFTFPAGEEAFADDTLNVSGPVLDPNTVRRVLTGSNIADSFNTGDSNPTVIEVRFIDNAIENGPGVDLIVFELSGDKPAGTPDPREIFDIAVWTGATFSAFARVAPVATGWNDPADSTLDVFAVQVDLSTFGVPAGMVIDRVRVAVFNANLGSKSADLTGLGALHSVAPIPEPSSGVLVLFGLMFLARRCTGALTADLER
jgi:hypothetical protein